MRKKTKRTTSEAKTRRSLLVRKVTGMFILIKHQARSRFDLNLYFAAVQPHDPMWVIVGFDPCLHRVRPRDVVMDRQFSLNAERRLSDSRERDDQAHQKPDCTEYSRPFDKGGVIERGFPQENCSIHLLF